MSSPPAPLPPDEPQRLQALRSYGVLDTPIEAAFDDITQIASQICGTPVALISLVDDERQWFKAETGLGLRETPLDVSICAHGILQSDLFEVPDTRLDPRFEHNPIVIGDAPLRFYAGAPLQTPDGFQLGMVCVLDNQPRVLSDAQRSALVALARQTMALMELRRSVRLAESMQQHLRRVMAIAGHDLKQPLQTIAMSLEIARLKTTDPRLAEQLSSGLRATLQLGRDLDDLALSSREATAVLVPQRSSVAMSELFAKLQNTWRAQADRKGLQLKMVPTSARVYSNPEMLTSILGNLIGNAIKYTREGRVLVGCRRLGARVRVDVLDTGIGIPAARQSDIFGAFQKVDPRTEGLGLGLSIVKSAVDLLGHEVQIRSLPGRGTCVSVLLARG